MLYEQVKGLAAEPFKRLTGVKPETFRVMVEGLQRAEVGKRKPGRPSKLNLEDQVLLTSRLHPEAFWLADSGYQGVQKLHANTEVPRKRRKGQCLTPE